MDRIFLLADDDYDDADLFGEALSKINQPIDFFHAEDSNAIFQFLDEAREQKPDLIFLDINMPEESGWQCLTRLKANERYRHIPVIMYSTSSARRDKETALRLGAVGLLTKPDNFKVLIRILDSIATTSVDHLPDLLSSLQ